MQIRIYENVFGYKMPEKEPKIAISKMGPNTKGRNSVKSVTKGSSVRTRGGGFCLHWLYVKRRPGCVRFHRLIQLPVNKFRIFSFLESLRLQRCWRYKSYEIDQNIDKI